jgi:phage tail-like protein
MADEHVEPKDGLSRRALLNTVGAVGGTVLAASMLSGTAAAQTTSPITVSRFALVIDGVELGVFSELLGITAEVDQVDYYSAGDDDLHISKLGGKLKPPTIELKRAMTGGMELWAWREAALSGQAAGVKKNCALIMFDGTGKPVARYVLTNAWPSRLELLGLKAGSPEPPMEAVTLVADAIRRVAP